MAIPLFLAMTHTEMKNCQVLPPHLAWTSWDFSPEKSHLIGFPPPPQRDALLVLDDRFPIDDQNPLPICSQLAGYISNHGTSGILLDFQRPQTPAATEFIRTLIQALPCPVAAPASYAQDLSCPIFLPPVPPHVTPEDYLTPWNQREIWLELALDACEITVTEQGSTIHPHAHAHPPEHSHRDQHLHCHYSIRQETDALHFYLFRTPADTAELLADPMLANVKKAIGLYQELA